MLSQSSIDAYCSPQIPQINAAIDNESKFTGRFQNILVILYRFSSISLFNPNLPKAKA